MTTHRLGQCVVAGWLAVSALPVASAPPLRVASLNLSADEVLAEILPHDRLVGVTRFVDDPETSCAAGRVPASVFRFQKADIEQLVARQPDLVVVSEYTDADFLKLVEKTGIRVHRMTGLDTLAGIRTAMLDLGRAVGAPAPAQTLVDRYQATLDDVQRRLAGAPRPKVLYWSGGMTAGANTTIGALIEGAGAVNLGRQLGVVGIAPPGAERAFVADPDRFLVATYPGATEALKQHALLSQLRAVRGNGIVAMPNQLLVALSQYSADAVWWLAARLHPERVPERRP